MKSGKHPPWSYIERNTMCTNITATYSVGKKLEVNQVCGGKTVLVAEHKTLDNI